MNPIHLNGKCTQNKAFFKKTNPALKNFEVNLSKCMVLETII